MANKEEKGQLLKKERKAKGFSLETVHESTKIPMDILRALEEGYSVRSLTPFYYKSFTKIYAQFLGIDLAVVIDGYHPEELPQPIKSKRSIFENEALHILKRERTKLVIKSFIVIFILFVFVKIFGFIGNKIKNIFSSNSPSVSTPLIKEKKKVEARQVREKKVKRSQAIPTAPTTATGVPIPSLDITKTGTSANKTVNVTVRAKKDSWLRVKADNQVVFQSTLKSGVAETWFADESVVISGRNINQLEFEFNGRMIGTLGRDARKVKKIIFTKDGLSVQK